MNDVFTDTCVLFDYAVESQPTAITVFEERPSLDKVISQRIQREFDSVATRQQDIHRELLNFVVREELDEYEPESVGSQKNDVRYVVDLYSELTELEEDVEAVRRLNELINRLEKARDELFGPEGRVTILTVDGVDAQLMGLLRGVIENEADVRVLCDVVAWRRNGGSGVFLTEDTEDILGDGESRDDEDGGDDEGGGGGLPDSFDDFFGTEDKSVPDRINDQIVIRYDSESKLSILSTGDFINRKHSKQESI
ncbi:hypothetical protein OB920_18630 [Halobacteria archaeon HArc-gm2]|nr:hypothetical protein [Halobacteria archaeon HArc-gm2]